ncbi:MAG: dihydrolipoamide acetyltransferase family protein [Azospirillaceae bacterium]
MAIEITVPKLSATMTEATVLRWAKAPGEMVEAGELLVELETDKAALEVEATGSGVLAERRAEEGDVVAVGAVLALLEPEAPPVKGGTAKAAAPGRKTESGKQPRKAQRLEDTGPSATASSSAVPTGAGSPMPGLRRPRPAPQRRVLATPLARRIAAASGVALEDIRGSGPRGRIRRRDVERAAASGQGRALASPRPVSGGALSTMRRRIAAQVAESRRVIPSFSLDRWVALDLVEDSRRLLNRRQEAAGGVRLTVTDFIVQAIADILPRHPRLAGVWRDGTEPAIDTVDGGNVGLVVALDDGLMIPVLQGLTGQGLAVVAERRRAAVEAARGGRLGADQSGPAAITFSNIGGHGVDRFEAIINPGETAILAMGRIAERPVARGGALAVARGASFTLSVDHRVVDGVVGAAFLGALADRLEKETWRL